MSTAQHSPDHQHSPGLAQGPGQEPDEQPEPQQAVVPAPKRGRGRQTALDMVRSMAVILAVVALVYWMVPRPNKVDRPAVDVGWAVTSAVDAWDGPASGVPVGTPSLPNDWEPNAAWFRDNGPGAGTTLHVGYLTPTEQFAAADITTAGTDAWVETILGHARQVDTADVAGWKVDRWESLQGNRRGLLLRVPAQQVGADPVGGNEFTYLIGGTSGWDELTLLAQQILPKR